MIFSVFHPRLDLASTWLWLLHDAGLNILGIPWWVWVLGGIALAVVAAIVAPELLPFLPEISEAVAEGAALEAEAPNLYVIGHGLDPLAYEGLDGYSVLHVPDAAWSTELNDEWIQTAIDQDATVLLSSPLSSETIVGSAEYGYETVYAREVSQLLNAGYSYFVDSAGDMLLVPP